MWRDARRARQAVASGPGVAIDVRVLETPLHSSLFALVNLVPEAQGRFRDVPCIARARTAGSRRARGARQCLCGATCVVGIR